MVWLCAGSMPMRVLHRLFLRLLERSVEFVRGADEEVAGERRGEAGQSRVGRLLLRRNALVLRLVLVFRGILLAEHHVMARSARDAVARERAVIRQRAHRIDRGRGGDLVDHRPRERLALIVDRVLPLAHDAVTAEAGVLNRVRGLLVEGVGLARELREEDRIASREPHRRAAPGAVGRNVDELSVRTRLGHVVLQAGAARAVAAETLIRCDELARRCRLAGLRPHAVVGLRRHLDLVAIRHVVAHRHAADRLEDFQERRVVVRIVAGVLGVLFAGALDAVLQALPGRIEEEVLGRNTSGSPGSPLMFFSDAKVELSFAEA